MKTYPERNTTRVVHGTTPATQTDLTSAVAGPAATRQEQQAVQAELAASQAEAANIREQIATLEEERELWTSLRDMSRNLSEETSEEEICIWLRVINLMDQMPAQSSEQTSNGTEQ